MRTQHRRRSGVAFKLLQEQLTPGFRNYTSLPLEFDLGGNRLVRFRSR